jgi:hypothetical protein
VACRELAHYGTIVHHNTYDADARIPRKLHTLTVTEYSTTYELVIDLLSIMVYDALNGRLLQNEYSGRQ